MSRAASPKLRKRAAGPSAAGTDGGATPAPTLQSIPIDKIDVPHRPARRFLGDIAALAESMQDYGLQQPIMVRADGDRYVVTSGMRRLAAARTLRWSSITAFVRSVSADDAYLLDLIENLQREDLSPEEEADAFGELIRTRGWTLQQVADSVKRSVGYVSKRVRVFEDPRLRRAITQQGLPVSTAEELLGSDPDQRAEFIERALAEHWDQAQARDAMRPTEMSNPELAGALDWGTQERYVLNDQDAGPGGRQRADSEKQGAYMRPRGLTRAIREFHRLLLEIHAEDLTQADRAALRALFRDLTMLARSPTRPRPPVFPPLPTVSTRTSRRRTSGPTTRTPRR